MEPLMIFPQGSLAESVITTVWLGAMVVIFFNSRFGWSLSGMINPGYLAPLLILKPLSVGVILLEGSLTYAFARLIFIAPVRFSWWNRVFGRERFFALILISVLVRLTLDGWLLPGIAAHFDLPLAWRSQFHGFGLVIVALIANQMWKPGFVRGMSGLLVCLAITWALTQFVLMQFTNFTISNVAYLYEDIAGSIEGAPKATIILLIAAFLASRMNLRYGWEYNGILVPSLLALAWYQPQVMLITIVEAVVIYGLATLILRVFKGVAIEGGVKLWFFFTLGFAYKMIMAHTLVWYAPTVAANDWFGLGYMLSALMAMKMHQKQFPVFLIRSVVQVSLVAAILGNVIGFGLMQWRPPPSSPPTPTPREPGGEGILGILRHHQNTLVEPDRQWTDTPVSLLDDLIISPNTALPEAWRLEHVEGYLVVTTPRAMFVGNPKGGDLNVATPFPRSERLTLEAGWLLSQRLNATWSVFGDGRAPGEVLEVRMGDDRLVIPQSLPTVFNLRKLTELVDVDLVWGETTNLGTRLRPPLQPRLRPRLELSRGALRRLLSAAQATREGRVALVEHSRHPALWAAEQERDTDRSRQPSARRALFFEAEVLRPLLGMVVGENEATEQTLETIAAAASAVHYELHRFTTPQSVFLALAERKGRRSGRGVYVFRLSPAEALQIQAPRPDSEPGTAGYAWAMFDALNARSLFIAGGQTATGEIDIWFQTAYQAELRAHDDQDFHVVQIRGARIDGVMAVADAVGRPSEFVRAMIHDFVGGELVWADGGAATAPFQAIRLAEAGYLDQTQGKTLTAVWLDQDVRDRYRGRRNHLLHRRRFEALGIPRIERDLASWLEERAELALEPGSVAMMTDFRESRDVMLLQALQDRGLHLTYVWDRRTAQPYLTLGRTPDRVALVVSLGHNSEAQMSINQPRNAVNRRVGLIGGSP